MIDTKDLRLQNLIEYKGKTCEVRRIHAYSIVATVFATNVIYGSNLPAHLIHGIPLTPEWLIKAGFVKRMQNLSFDAPRYCIDNVLGETFYLRPCSIGGFFWGFYRFIDDKENKNELFDVQAIKSVHALQNFYHSLSGTELTFDSQENKEG